MVQKHFEEMLNTHPQTQARGDLILELCALSADVPVSLLSKLSGSERWTRDTVGQLVKAKMIRRCNKDKIKSIRLTKKGKDILLEADRERFCNLLEGAGATRFRKTDLPFRARQHRLAGVYLLLMQANIAIHRDDKADIFGTLPWKTDTASVLAKWAVPSFYSSVEIKAQGKELIRIKGTRAMGALFTKSPSPFIVYHTGAMPLKWSEKSEHKLAGVVEGTLINWKLPSASPRGLMVGDSMEVLPKLLTSDGGFRHYYYKVDNAYGVFNFIPQGWGGRVMLTLLIHERLRQGFAGNLMSGFESADYHIFACDAMDGKRPVLFAWDLDMVKLWRFKNGVEETGEPGLVLCMDFQSGALRSYFGNLAEIRVFDWEPILKGVLDGI
jgi:hypothetical protein